MTLQRIPVSELSENTDVSPAAVVHVVQDGVSKKATVGRLISIGDFATIADMAASEKLTDGEYYTASSAFNGEPETFRYDADSTATADGALIVDATGMGAGRLVSTRKSVASTSELAKVTPFTGASVSLLEGAPRTKALFGRFGVFRWQAGDFTREIDADTQHETFRNGVFVESSVAGFDKSQGAWVRNFEGPVNVAWYGAQLDRVTDDTEAFNAALYSDTEFLSGGVTAANNDKLMRRTVYVPNGDAYLAGTVYVRKGQTLMADGWGATRLIAPIAAGTAPVVKMGFGRIDDVVLVDPGGLPPSVTGFATEGGPLSAAVIDCTGVDGAGIAGATIKDLFITAAPLGVRAAGGDVSVIGVTFDDGGIGVQIEGSRNSVIGCHFFSNSIGIQADGPVADWIIEGNTFGFQSVSDINLRTVMTGYSTWSNATDYAIGDRAYDGSTAYQCVVAQDAAGSGTFSDYRTSNPDDWIEISIRGLNITGNNFVENSQTAVGRVGCVNFDTTLQQAQVTISGNVFSNMKERAIRGASQGDMNIVVKGNAFEGLRPNQRYTQSTTSRGVLVGGGYWELSGNTYKDLHGQPIEVGATRASSRVVVDGETWDGCTSGGEFLSITNLASTAILEIDNCKGDNVMPMIAASNHVGVRIGLGNKRWLGAVQTSGSRQYYVIPTFMVDMRVVTVSAYPGGANPNWRRSCMYAMERGVVSPSGTGTDHVDTSDLHVSSVATGTPVVLDVQFEIGAIGDGATVSPAAILVGREILVSVPTSYGEFRVAA